MGDHIARAEVVGSCDGGDCDRRAVSMAYCERIDSLTPVCRRHLCAYKVLHGRRWQAEDEWVGLRFARRSRWKFLAQWKLLLDQRLTIVGFDPQRRRRARADRIERDKERAEVERLRAGIEALTYALGPGLPTTDRRVWDATRSAAEMAHDLLNPTEGEN